MREFKFRVWDKKYHTFDYNGSPELFISTEGEVYEKDERNWAMQTWIEYNESDFYELSQYTGLKDKNGKEIYEWDLVEDNIGIGVVEFKDGAYRVNYRNGVCKWFIDYLDSEKRVTEVIGNIYENPELLDTAL